VLNDAIDNICNGFVTRNEPICIDSTIKRADIRTLAFTWCLELYSPSLRSGLIKEDGIKKKIYIKPMNHQQKLSLFNDIRAGKNVDKVNDKKLINSAIWGERKFMRAVVRLGMLLRGTLNVAPANITDEAIDEALTARSEVIKRNTKRAQGESINSLSFRTYKDLRQTITIRAQNFSSSTWDCFYITYLHTPLIYTSHRYKPNTILNNNQRALYPLHFEKKRKNNKWPIPHKVSCDSKLTYFRQTNEWKLAWVYETQKQLRETQADSSVHAVSFTWYSPTKGVGKLVNMILAGLFVYACIWIILSQKKIN
jgi:hypothetical protein